jgi:anthranilate/para-aminobenzoate synthase component II
MRGTDADCTLIVAGCAAGRPEDSGISLQTVRELGPDFPVFGVCMGHQCIGEAFGGVALPPAASPPKDVTHN